MTILLALTGCHSDAENAPNDAQNAPQAGEPGAPEELTPEQKAEMEAFFKDDIRLLPADQLAALGPKNDLPTDAVFQNAHTARVLRPKRFAAYPGAPEVGRFLQFNPELLPNWKQFQSLDLVIISQKFSFVDLLHPQTGETLGRQFPFPSKAVYIEKSEPIAPEALQELAFGTAPKEKIAEATYGGKKVSIFEQSIEVPLDEAQQNMARINGIIFALYAPSPDKAVIVSGPKEVVEKFFSIDDGDQRGVLAQRLGRTDTANADFTFLFDFESPMKHTIQLPVNQELADSLSKDARAVTIFIDASAAEGSDAVHVAIDAVDAEAAGRIESTFGAALMKLGEQVESPKLPEGVELPKETADYMKRSGELVKSVTMEKTENRVVAGLKKSPQLDSLFTDLIAYANQSAEKATRGAKYQAVAQTLTFLGRLMNNIYYGKNNKFPPMAILSADGKPLLSWRVAILPALGPDGEKLYNEFKLDQPWDGPDNIKLLDKMPRFYQSPVAPEMTNKTTYRIFTGPGTPFGKSPEPLTVADIPNPGKTFMIVSTRPEAAVEWTCPDELTFDPDKLGELFDDIVLAVPVMGEVFAAPYSGQPDEIKGLTEWILGQTAEKEEGNETPAEPAASPLDEAKPAE